jgi:hypothetical protein
VTARAKLHIVADGLTEDELREASAKAGKRVCDELRAYILSRNWGAVHVAADRRAPLHLPDQVKRLWAK